MLFKSGKATVYSKNGQQFACLSYDEQLTSDIEYQALQTIQVDALKYSAWKEGKLVFKNEDMKQVARRLSRWYNAEVIWVDDPILSGYNLQATFIDDPLDEVLKLISHSTPFIYKEEKDQPMQTGVSINEE